MSIRITGGILRGRLLTVPKRGVRPTQDRVRAAIFSSLQSVIPGARILDLFAGTGAFGLEALSRGAALACFVEADRSIASCLKTNIIRLLSGPVEAIKGGAAFVKERTARQWQIINDDAALFLKYYPVELPFHIVFADPPYDPRGEWAKKILFHLSNRSILAEEGFFIIELSAKSPPIETHGWHIYRERLYGETRICIYRLKKKGAKAEDT